MPLSLPKSTDGTMRIFSYWHLAHHGPYRRLDHARAAIRRKLLAAAF
jgi:hypothetical protein